MNFIMGGIGILWCGLCGAIFGLGGVVFGVATCMIIYGIKQVVCKK